MHHFFVPELMVAAVLVKTSVFDRFLIFLFFRFFRFFFCFYFLGGREPRVACYPSRSLAFPWFPLLSLTCPCFPFLFLAFLCFPLLALAFPPRRRAKRAPPDLVSPAFSGFPLVSLAFPCVPLFSLDFSGRVLGGFGGDWGGFWERLGRVLGNASTTLIHDRASRSLPRQVFFGARLTRKFPC